MKNLNIKGKKQSKAIFSFIVLLCCLFGFMGNVEAQVRKGFTQRSSTHPDNLVNGQPIKKIYNVKGDFTMIGNTNMRRTDESSGDNSSQSMKFVNVDNSRINSSSATLQVPAGLDPACTNIVFAGLYWSGRANTNNMDVESGSRTEYSYASVPSNQTNRTIYSNTSSIDYTSYSMSIDIDGNDRIFTFSSSVSGQPTVQFKRRTSNGSAVTYRMGTNGSWSNLTSQPGGGNTSTLSSPFVIFDEGVNGVKFTLDQIGYTNSNGSFVRISVTGQYQVENQVPVLLNKRKVQIKGPGSSTYTELEANPNDIRYNNISGEDNNQMYAGYVEITDYVKTNRFGEYTIADLALSEGNGGNTGYYGGWGMVVIYENQTMKWRDVTVFDGFAYVASGNNSEQIALSGFQAAQHGDVNVTMGIMAGEGDKNIGEGASSSDNRKPDYFEIATAGTYQDATPVWNRLQHGGNLPGNFFNSSIYTGATPTPRNPLLTNNTGVDIAIFDIPNAGNSIIANNQTGTKFKYGTEQDTYIIYNITFAVDAYIPEVEPENKLVSINGTPVSNQHDPTLTLNPGQELIYTLTIKNTGAEAINNAVVNIPMPYTGIYVSSSGVGSSGFTPANQPVFNPVTGMLTWNLGTLPKTVGDPVLATMTYKIRVTDDCYVLTNNECPAYMIVDGSVSGTGANSQASLGDAGNFIFGRNSGGAVCENSVITSPTGIKVNPGSNCSGTEFQNKTILFCESDVIDNKIPVSVIRNQFPAGTRFYSGINPGTFQGTGTEYNNDTPFPGTPGTEITYYGIPPRGEGSTCSFMFKIKVTSIEGVPNVTNPTYCVGEEAPLLSTLATVSVPGYQLFFYESATATTPLDVSSLHPSTAAITNTTYWVAQGTTTCIGERVSFAVNVIEGPKISTQPQDLILCEGSTGSVSVTATGTNLTYTWEYYNGTTWVSLPNATQDKISINGSTLTLTGASLAYNGSKVRVSVSNGSCSVISGEATITVNALPAAPVSGNDQVVCESSPIQTLTATASVPSGHTVVWYDAATGGNVVASPILNTVGTVTYYAASRVTDGGCESLSRTAVTLTITAAPAAPVSGNDQVVCESSPIQTLTATASVPSGHTVVWYDAATGGNVVASPILNTVGTVTYYAASRVTDGGCESLSRTAVTLTITAAPAAPVSGNDQVVCESSPIQTLTATASVPSGHTVVWYDAATGGNVVASPILNTVGTVTYYAASRVTDGGCESLSRTAVTLTITAAPAAPVSGNDQVVCESSPIQTLTATASVPSGHTVVWYDAATGGNVVASPILNTVGTVTYYAASRVTDGGCESLSRTAVTLTITAAPAAPVSGNDQVVCESSPIQTLTATASVPSGHTVVWYDAATGGNVVASPTLNTVGTVTYYAASRVTDGGCESLSRTAVTLTITAAPAAPVSGNDQVVCESSPIQTLTATASVPTGHTVVWYDAATGGNVVASPTLNTVGTVTYYAASRVTDGGCESLSRTAVTLTITAAPAAPVSGNDQVVCESSPIQTLTATASVPSGHTVVWYDAATGGNVVASPTLNTVGTVTYYAASRVTDGGCESLSRTAVTLTITAAPAAPVSGNDKVVCESSPIQTLTATASVPSGHTVVWYDAATGGNVVASPILNTVGTVTYYAASRVTDGGCESLSRTAVTLTITAAPAAPVSGNDQVVCESSPIQTLTATASVPSGHTVVWYDAATGGSVVASPTLNTVGTVTYYAASRVTDGGCESLSRTAVTLTITAAPAAPVSGNDQVVCESSPIQTLTATASVPSGHTVVWYDAATGGNVVASPTLNTVGTVTYYAASRVTDGGCESLSRTAVMLTINPLPIKYEVSGSGSYCFGTAGVTIGLSGSETGISYQLVRGGVNVGLAVVGNGNAIDFGKHVAGTYSVVATNTTTQCAVDMTGNAVIVENMVQGGSITGAQIVCVGTVPNTFTSSVDAIGTGIITYQWESKVAGGTWTMIANATSATYSPGAATVETSYRRVAYSTIGIISSCPAYSNEITITIASDCNFIAVKTVSDNGNDGNTINNKAESNENLTYSITIDNNYDRDIVVNISDAIPANTTFVSVQNGGIHSAGTITWDNVTVLKGGSTTVTFVVKATADLTGIANIVNTAVVSSPGLATQNPNVTIPTDSKPSHSSVKTVVDENGDNKAQSGEELTYTITVKNTGDVALTGIAISDAIPANTSYVPNSATGGGTLTGNTLDWSVAVPFGGEVSVSFKVTVNADLTGVTSIKNIATVGGDTPEVEIPTDSKPSHSSVKTVVDENGDNKAQSGEELTYTITVKNTGDVALTGVAISDAIPANTSYVPNSATGGGTLTGNTLDWSVAVPFGGEVSVSFKVTVNADLTGVTSIKNIATVGGDTPEVEIPTDSKPSHSSVKTVADENGDNKAQSGEELTYTITVKNTGDVALTGIAISDAIPANTTYVANSATGGGTLTGNTLDWSVAVPFGGEVSVSFKVTVNADLTGVTSIKNIATVGGDTPEVEIPTDSKPSHSSVKTVVDASGDNKAQSGEELTYTITVKNTGDVALTGIAISDAIPANTTYVANSATGGGTLTGNTLDWSVAVPFGGEVSVSFKVTVNADLTGVTSIKNIATVGGDTPEVEIPTDSKPSHSSVKTVVDENGDNKAQSGEELTYTITVKNTGDVALTGVAISDAIPANTSYVPNSATGGGTLTGNTLDWSVAVPFGGEVSVSFKVTVNADLTGVTSIKNIATVGGDTPEVEIPTDSKPSHSSVKTVVDASGDNKAQAGELLTYTIKIENDGDVDLKNLLVTDMIPAYTTYEEGTASNGAVFNSGKLTWTVNVPFGQALSLSFKVKVNGDLTEAAEIRNIATVGDKDTPPAIIETDRFARISLDQKHNLGTSNDCFGLKVNDKITYTFTVKNTGNVALNNLDLTSTLSPRLGNITSTAQGALLPGATREFTAEYVINQADINRGFVTGTAKVIANTPVGQITGAVGGKVEVPSNEVSVNICQTGKVAIEKTVDKQEVSKVGEELTYTIKVTNTGNTDLEEVTVEDAMLNLKEVINLTVGEVKTYQLKYTVTYNDLLKTSLDNIASATLKTREKVTDEASTKVRFEPEISIVKSADKSVITFLGELVEYTIEVTNTGTVDLVSVVVTDPMFPNFIGTVGNLAKGETRKFDLTYESVLADIIRGEIRNTARVQGKVGGAVTLRSFNPATGVIEKLSNEVLVKVIFNNVLEVTKDADKTEVNKEGEVITYTIKVANKGNYDLTDVVVKDPLTGMMETVGNMAVGAEKTFKTTYKVRRADFDKGSIVNEVLVTAKDLAGGQLDGRAERIVGIAKMPFFIPNVFTPNDDGTNDTFEIEGIEGFDRIEVTILNRWGNEVYRNSNYKNEWTGHGLNEGTYFYIVKTIKGTKEDLYKGHVLIKTR